METFCSNFLANLLSDATVAIVFGLLLNWIANKKLNDFVRSQQRKDEKRAEVEKAIRYLEFLNIETKYLVGKLPSLINAFQETGWGREIPIPTPFWEILKPSGELPKLLRAEILSSLTLFYDPIAYAKRGLDLVIDSWLVSLPSTVPGMHEKREAFLNMTLTGLTQALSAGENLQNKLDSEIDSLKGQLRTS